MCFMANKGDYDDDDVCVKRGFFIAHSYLLQHISYRGVAHRQQIRQYDVEKAEENLTYKKTQRDDLVAQKVI